jgi:hypothetical protein
LDAAGATATGRLTALVAKKLHAKSINRTTRIKGDEAMKTTETTITGHKVVAREEWIAARKELLSKEKELTRLRDQLAAERAPCLGCRSRRSILRRARGKV